MASASSTLASTRATIGPIALAFVVAFAALFVPFAVVAVALEVSAGAEDGTEAADAADAADPPKTGLSLERPDEPRCDDCADGTVSVADGGCCCGGC